MREIFGIDLPWLLDTFGPVKHLYVEKDKLSALEIDYPDTYFTGRRHENGTKGVLAVDVVSPKAVRNFEVFGEGLHLFWEGSPQSLAEYDAARKCKVPVDTYTSVEHDARYSDNIVENAYADELEEFFAVLEGRGTAPEPENRVVTEEAAPAARTPTTVKRMPSRYRSCPRGSSP